MRHEAAVSDKEAVHEDSVHCWQQFKVMAQQTGLHH